jgi:hypothetical protein
MSTLKVDNIKSKNNTNNSISIDSTGRVFSNTIRPAFSVKGVTNTTQGSRVIVFGTSVQFNRGDHYNSNTGIFNCPISGFYHFDWHMLAYNTSAERFLAHFYINSSIVAECTTEQPTAGTGSGFGNLGLSINLNLNQGDLIYMASTAGTLNSAVNYGHFSGFLLG